MDYNLMWRARVTAFFYEAGALVVTVLIGLLSSDDFARLIDLHFGGTIVGSLIMLVLSGALKHFRNIKLADEVGGLGRTKVYI